jgi:two-component system, NarL family, nitrate/nitrite response regulator NarL
MNNSVRVAIVDDHPLFREGVASTLASMTGIEVVGEGANASDALRIARELAPDVMLLDVRLAGGGIEAAGSIARTWPTIRIIMLTASENEQDVALALRAGARGYILKGSSGSEVVDAVRTVVEGDSYVAPNLAARLLTQKGKQIEAVVEEYPRDLTCRETEVFALVARGLSNKEIARNFQCTERTVKHHVTNIMQKLNVRNRVQAALKFQTKKLTAPTA